LYGYGTGAILSQEGIFSAIRRPLDRTSVASQRAREERTLSITSWTVLNNGFTVLETEVAVQDAMISLGVMRTEARQWGWTAKDAENPVVSLAPGSGNPRGSPEDSGQSYMCLEFGEVGSPFAVSAPSAVK
jgi:hypothetical protein